MKLNYEEAKKLLNFILKNKHKFKKKYNPLYKWIISILGDIIKNKKTNGFELTVEQEQFIINIFINNNISFNEFTPNLILENPECIKHAIKKDINNVNFIKASSSELESYIITEALSQNFILKKGSPDFLKKNPEIALNSIKLKSQSANFIHWNCIPDNKIDILIDEILNSGYILSNDSPKCLTQNKKIILESIKKDKYSIKYATEFIKHNKDFFEYLLVNNYFSADNFIQDLPLDFFLEPEIMYLSFKTLNLFECENETYISRFTQLYNEAINSKPSIKTFDSVFQIVAEKQWERYKKEWADDYTNIFGKICGELNNAKTFEEAINNLEFLNKIQNILGEKYNILHQAMNDYFHNIKKNKLEKIQDSKDKIAKFSALYVAKSKELYKKYELEMCYDYIKEYFILKTEHPYIKKRIIQIQTKDKFLNLYNQKDISIHNFINTLEAKYQNYKNSTNPDIIKFLVHTFVYYNYTKLEQFFPTPSYFEDYKRYEKAIKLINRLNKGYIKFDDSEVFNYKDIISLNNDKKYIYTGRNFDESEVTAYDQYKKIEQLFEKIKYDITQKASTLEVDTKIDEKLYDKLYDKLCSEVPFSDEYFEFDTKEVLKLFTLHKLIVTSMPKIYQGISSECKNFTCDESFENIRNTLLNNGLIWLLLFLYRKNNFSLKEIGINKKNIIEIIDNMDKLTKRAEEFKFDISKLEELLFFHELNKYSSVESLAILGGSIIEKLYKNPSYTESNSIDIINNAKELVCQMAKRSKSTVPYVSGETMNYKYSLYDSQDETILLTGIYTNACFKIEGIDNDFLHYCALDKNGFVIKITDNFGNFIARASGFRNGNCIIINQLRTIHDRGGNHYNSEYDNARKEIIETLKKACQDIIITSKKNKQEKNKINFALINKSYCLFDYDNSIISNIIATRFKVPMDNKSKDWKNFISNTKNLRYAKTKGSFTTDYGAYPIICIASSKKIRYLNVNLKDVPALYERKRNKIVVSNTPDIDIFKKINKIEAIKCYYDETSFIPIELPKSSTVFVGDNWYIIYNNGNIVKFCILHFDNKAKIEFEAVRQTIFECKKDKNQKHPNIEQITQYLKSQDFKENAVVEKIKKLGHK